VEKSRQLKPDLLILDIGMPELNGVDAGRRILKDNPLQRILVLTDVRSEQAIRDCLEAGVRGWIYKSDDLADLITAVENIQQHRSTLNPMPRAIGGESYAATVGAGKWSGSSPGCTTSVAS
jgi:DNA-binding NarL/FixJ family response regulator